MLEKTEGRYSERKTSCCLKGTMKVGVLYECCKVKMKCRCHKMKWEWRTCDTTRVYGSLPFCISLIPRSSILFAINSIFYILLNIYNMYLKRVTLSLRCCKINERFSIQVPRHGKTWVRMQLFFFLLFFFVLFLRFVESI